MEYPINHRLQSQCITSGLTAVCGYISRTTICRAPASARPVAKKSARPRCQSCRGKRLPPLAYGPTLRSIHREVTADTPQDRIRALLKIHIHAASDTCAVSMGLNSKAADPSEPTLQRNQMSLLAHLMEQCLCGFVCARASTMPFGLLPFICVVYLCSHSFSRPLQARVRAHECESVCPRHVSTMRMFVGWREHLDIACAHSKVCACEERCVIKVRDRLVDKRTVCRTGRQRTAPAPPQCFSRRCCIATQKVFH